MKIKDIIRYFDPHEWMLIAFLVVVVLMLTGCATPQKQAYSPIIIEMYKCGEPYALIIQDTEGRVAVSKPHHVLGDDTLRGWLYSVIDTLPKDGSRNIAKNDIEQCTGI